MKELAITLVGVAVVGWVVCCVLEAIGNNTDTEIAMYAAFAFILMGLCARMAWILSDSIEREAVR